MATAIVAQPRAGQSKLARSGLPADLATIKVALGTIAQNAHIAVNACEGMNSDDAHILQSLLLRIGVTADHVLATLGAFPVRGDAQAWMLGGEA